MPIGTNGIRLSVALEAPRLPITLRPEAGENVHGFVRRLAGANGHRGLRTFARPLGLGSGFGPASADRAWERLAQATGLTIEEVGAMRWNATGGRAPLAAKIVVAGTLTAKGFAHPRNTRLCLACLRETGIQRDFWLFSCVVACPHHGSLLATTCNCGRLLLPGTYGRTWECACRAVPGDLAEVAAPASAVRIARNLAARVGTASGYACENDLKAPFDALCAHDYMVLVHTLGVAAATLASEDAPVMQGTGNYSMGAAGIVQPLDMALTRLQAAASIIDGWPDAYVGLLRTVEGRNTEADASTIAGAFATSIGKMLLSPIRGADGLPLRILIQAVGRYWNDHHEGKRRRRRNLSTSDPTAKRIQMLLNATGLARAVGMPHGTAFLGRVLGRILEGLNNEERALKDGDLVPLVRERAIALYRAATVSLPPLAVKNIVEGANRTWLLSGWEHPRLMPADRTLHGLRFKGRPAYTPEVVEATLARLRGAARRVERFDGLSPLTSEGLQKNTQPWYNKTDVLLDVLDGRLAVYAVVDAPRLSDLLVNIDDLRRASCARSPVNRLASGGGFGTYKQVNVVLHGRFGVTGRLTLNEFRRLARGRVVQHQIDLRTFASSKQPQRRRLYNVEEVVGFVQRRLSPGGLPSAEAAAFGRIDDIGPLLIQLKTLGMTANGMAADLARRGVRTKDGATWGRSAVAQFIEGAEESGKMLGLLTGPGFTSLLWR